MKNSFFKKAGAVVLAAAMCFGNFANGQMVAFAEEAAGGASYTLDGVTFDKLSHPNSPVSTPDGIVDYVGNGAVSVPQEGGTGDRGQSYSWSAISYGDWVYVGTCYAAMGNTLTLMDSVLGDSFDKEIMKATLNAMFNGTFFYGQEDGVESDGVLVKVNVKTGETKIIMAKSENGMAPLFRNAIRFKDKLYFCGSVSAYNADGTRKQPGMPSIYEIDPKTDTFQCVYQGLTLRDYAAAYLQGICTGIRGMAVYGDRLVVSCVGLEGAYILISSDPSQGASSFTKIATQQDLFDYPAYHYSDSIYGGSVWEIVTYNGDLYVALCTGRQNKYDVSGNQIEGNQPDEHTMQSFAIVKGHEEADGSFTWTSLVGDKERDGARYTFGIDPERTRAGACNMVIYNGYLYIGEYEDIEIALEDVLFKQDVQFLAKNLEQSVSLYRMDPEENMELVVGNPTTMFPEGGISGLGSGFGHQENQYIWQSKVYDGKLYLGTFDSSSLLQPIGQFTNGDLLHMSKEEWISQLNYLKVLLELLMNKYPDITPPDVTGSDASGSDVSGSDAGRQSRMASVFAAGDGIAAFFAAEDRMASVVSENDLSDGDADDAFSQEVTEEEARAMVADAVSMAQSRYGVACYSLASNEANDADAEDSAATAVTLSEEQIQQLVNGILEHRIYSGAVEDEEAYDVMEIAAQLDALTAELSSQGNDDFAQAYADIYDLLRMIYDQLPQNLKDQLDKLVNALSRDNLRAFGVVLSYLCTAERGFDMYTTSDGIHFQTITTNGFGDPYNHGCRVFATGENDSWMVIGTANPFYGTQLWKMRTQTVTPEDPKPEDPKPEGPKPEDPTPTPTPGQGTTEDGGNSSDTSASTTQVKSPKTGEVVTILPGMVLAMSVTGMAVILWKRKKEQ